jgi:arsenate reductase (thioredoxin)
MDSGALSRDDAERIARNLRAMADPTRVQLLSLIVNTPAGRRSVTDLAETLGITQPTVSHHLRIMADENVLLREQIGRVAWYSVTPSRLGDVFDSVRNDPVATAVAPPVLDRIADDLAPRFRGVFSPQTVASVVRSSYSLLVERAHITRYLPSLTSRFAADRLRALAEVDGLATTTAPRVLFVCVQNAGRSQLASALLRARAGDRVRVLTAGSEPAATVNPLVVAALDEVGVSIGAEYPKPLTDEIVRAADVVISMGCGDACPVYPGKRYLEWELPDPAGMPMNDIRAVRDDIERRVRTLLDELV